MKKRYTLLTLFFSLGLLLTFSTKSYAATFVTEDYTLEQDEAVEDDLYVTGEQVTINGLVDGDLFIAGQTVKLEGTVTGNLYVMAQSLSIDGNVYGNTYAMSQYSTFSGIFSNSLFNMSQAITVDGEIGQDLFSMSAMATIEGNVDEDLRLLSGQADITGEIAGDAIVSAGTVNVDETKISGEYIDDAKLAEIYPDIKVQEDVTINYDFKEVFAGLHITSKLIGLIGMFLVGLVFIRLMPVKTIAIKEKITGSTNDFFYSLLVGFGIMVLIPLPLIVLMISLVGFPIGILILGALIFISIFGKLWVEIAFGEELLELFGKEEKNYYLSLLTGRVLSVLINFVPILRFFYNSILNMVALGAIVRMKSDQMKIKTSVKKPVKRVAKKSTVKKTTKK
jgi:cytoskeletal protein CcmA (bactofilin family)